MSLRPVAAPASTGSALRTVAPSPYNDRQHLTPNQYEDHDGGPWADTPKLRPQFVPVPNKWVVAPALGAKSPAIAIFPKRNSNKISFAPDVHLQFQTVWTPIVARFSQIFLVDVDKKGNMPQTNQQQHWIATFRGKTDTGITSVVIRIRVNNTGDQLEGWALYLPDTDFVQSFVNFPAPPASAMAFESDTAVVVNGALTTYNEVNGGVVVALESVLDNEVERGRRVERARQGWDLFIRDVKERSANTMDTVNDMRMQVYYDYFRGKERNADFWQVDEERAPE